MKKFWIVLLSLLLSLGCVFGFAACDETPPDDETGGTVQPGGPGKPHEHDFGEWTVTISATCTEEGEEQRTCSCGETETRPIAAKGHTEAIDAAVAPTCTETGLTEGKHCSVCNEVLVEQEVLQTIPHNYVDGVCTRCEDTIAATDDSYFIFTELEDGTYSVALGLDPKILFEVVIPREHDGRPVTQIEDRAFMNCTGLTSITIPDSVTSIGDLAFNGCMNLGNVTIGSSVTSIGVHAFYECWWLTSITVSAGNPVYHSDENCLIETESKTLVVGCENSIIPDDGSVTSIGKYAFSCCPGLASISIPDSVTSIGAWAFENCYDLTSITIPDSVTSIGNGAFSGCYSLTSISIPDSVTSIGEGAFFGCSCLTSITIPDGVTSIERSVFGWCDSLTSITISDSVTSIGEWAFYGCESLTSVTIPDSVISIGNGVFTDCDSLTSITIPDSVTSIGERVFENCNSLTSVIFENPSGWNAGSAVIPVADLSDPATAAEYLTDTYLWDNWIRE